MQVLVRDNNVDQALKALKKKMQREGIFREMKLRGHYEKPSEKKAREKAEAVRRARKLARKKMQREGLIPMKPKLMPGAPGAERGGRGGPAAAGAARAAAAADSAAAAVLAAAAVSDASICSCRLIHGAGSLQGGPRRGILEPGALDLGAIFSDNRFIPEQGFAGIVLNCRTFAAFLR